MSEISSTTTSELKKLILEMASSRGLTKSFCPSEVARKYDATNWRKLMEPVRAAAHELAGEGKIVITQKGQPVDLCTVRGPIRLKLAETSKS